MLDAGRIPLASGAAELAQRGCFSGGANRAREFLAEIGWIDPSVEEWRAKLCLDAETSGGLLVALPAERGAAFREALRARGEEAWEIGRVEAAGERAIRLEAGGPRDAR